MRRTKRRPNLDLLKEDTEHQVDMAGQVGMVNNLKVVMAVLSKVATAVPLSRAMGVLLSKAAMAVVLPKAKATAGLPQVLLRVVMAGHSRVVEVMVRRLHHATSWQELVG